MRVFIALTLLALLAFPAAGDVLIHQVLVDPVGTDTGGEAVELINTGPDAVAIGNWWLETQSSSKDATIPNGTLLLSGAQYLLADAGWSTLRDEPLWRDGDHEEALTLSNDNAGIALHAGDGTIIDRLGWGDPTIIKLHRCGQ